METPEQTKQRWIVRRTMSITSFVYVILLLPFYAFASAYDWIDEKWIAATAPLAMIVVPVLITIILKYIHDATKDDIQQRKDK